jgi:hypothetical protein
MRKHGGLSYCIISVFSHIWCMESKHNVRLWNTLVFDIADDIVI